MFISAIKRAAKATNLPAPWFVNEKPNARIIAASRLIRNPALAQLATQIQAATPAGPQRDQLSEGPTISAQVGKSLRLPLDRATGMGVLARQPYGPCWSTPFAGFPFQWRTGFDGCQEQCTTDGRLDDHRRGGWV